MENPILNFTIFLSDLRKEINSKHNKNPAERRFSRINQLNVPKSQEKWMSFLPSAALLNQIIVPGSHCSNSYNLDSNLIKKTYSRTQSISVADQLKMGIRKIDLRVGSKGLKKQKNIKMTYEKIVEACLKKQPKEANQLIYNVIKSLYGLNKY
jgi:hypothetical protein